jgi:hypothetical protein
MDEHTFCKFGSKMAERLAALCREFGISRKTGYKIFNAMRNADWCCGWACKRYRSYRHVLLAPETEYAKDDRLPQTLACGRLIATARTL